MINLPFGGDKEFNKFVDDYAKRNTVNIDNRDFFFGVVVSNGKQKKVFNKSGIQELVIEDDLFQWYTKGYMRISNDEDALERTSGPEKFLQMLGFDPNYKIRGDGRDILSINITPHLETINLFMMRVSGLNTQPDNDVYKLSNDFAIYDIKTEYEGNKQFKVFYFWDLRYQLLLERNIHYSTALVKTKEDSQFVKKVRQVNNKDREIESGKAIKEFIKQSLEDQKPEFDDDLWDQGGSKVFYSSPAQFKGINDLDALMADHVSSDTGDNDFSILKFDIYTKKWTLISMSKYFETALQGKKAGDYQYDKFQINAHGGNIPWFLSMLGAKNKAPNLSVSDVNSRAKSMKVPPALKKLGQTFRKNMPPGESLELEPNSWKFEDLVGIDNQTLLTTYAVHSYNISTHEFNIDVFDNEIQTVSENFNEQYIEKNFLGDPKPLLNFLITPGKKQQKVLNNMYTLNIDQKLRAIRGRNQLYRNLIFLNQACALTVKGDTYRRSGRFFSLDRKQTYFDNEFDQKILGQYLVVNTKHIFDGETYKNEILGVKPYRFAKPELEQEKIAE